MKYASKQDLLTRIHDTQLELRALLDEVPRSRWREPGVWGDDWSVHDLVAHLAEWLRMFLSWHCAGLEGRAPEMPAPGYRWNETPRLNRDIQSRHADRPTAEVVRELDARHEDALAIVRGLSEAQLLEPGHFEWTGRNALVTYLGANTVSHYRFAVKVLRRWLRSCARAAS